MTIQTGSHSILELRDGSQFPVSPAAKCNRGFVLKNRNLMDSVMITLRSEPTEQPGYGGGHSRS